MSYLVIFRTHVWDSGVVEMARRAAACCASGQFVVSTDNSHGPLPVEGFPTLAHTADFSALHLPNLPADQTLWWNADYILYLARAEYPEFEYYVMLEYDVLVKGDFDQIIKRCSDEKIDFVGHDIKPLPEGHWSWSSAASMAPQLKWAFLPFIVISGRATDELLQVRRSMVREWDETANSAWPYCEAFIPTAVWMRSEFKSVSLDQFLSTELLRHRPFISLLDGRLAADDIVAHPVFSGRRFIEAFVSSQPDGSHLTPWGKLWPELSKEDPADLKAALGEDYIMLNQLQSGQYDKNTSGGDVARNKPATQSSISQWSRASTKEADARRAISGIIPVDYAFHTDVELEPWWRVDLLSNFIINAVVIVNRTQYEYRFTQFRIESSEDGSNWTVVLTKSDDAPVSSDQNKPDIFVFKRPVSARYIRVVQLGRETFSLRQVRVIGVPISPGASEQPVDLIRRVIEDPDAMAMLREAISSTVHHHVFGRSWDSYDVDTLQFLSAGIEANQYAQTNMLAAQKFSSAELLHDHAVGVTRSSGLILEFGVFSGRTINHLALRLPSRRIFGFDSFEGLPEDWRPGFDAHTFKTEPPVVRENVELIVGWFEDTLPAFVEENRGSPIALLHVDCDLYSATKTIFDSLKYSIVRGTVIIFDEYLNYPEWRLHEYKAFQEFVQENKVSYEYLGWVPRHQQVSVRITSIERSNGRR